MVHNDGGNEFNILNTATNTRMYLKAPSLEAKTEWINAINQQIGKLFSLLLNECFYDFILLLFEINLNKSP